MPDPRRGEIYLIDLGEPLGHEAGFARPALVVSDDRANQRGLVIACPLTRSRRGYPTHIEIEPAASGLDEVSYVQTEQIRTLSTARLITLVGRIEPDAMWQVQRAMRMLLRL
ncbi:MAG: type II toxin-antitoxin system PemK/MazF family toxin [Sporichthyaceae bacterium]